MQSLGEVFPEFLSQIAHDEELCLIFLRELWPRLVGEAVSRRCQPRRLRQRRLTLDFSSQAWGRELENLAPDMIRSVNTYWRCTLIERIELEFHPMD